MKYIIFLKQGFTLSYTLKILKDHVNEKWKMIITQNKVLNLDF